MQLLGSAAGLSRLQLYLCSGRRNLPSPAGWSQKDGAGWEEGKGLSCKEKTLGALLEAAAAKC